MHLYVKKAVAGLAAAALILLPAAPAFADGSRSQTATPIKHLVIIFQENVSFDHYFATYPNAQPNLDQSVYFSRASSGTPTVNGLSGPLLTNNPMPTTPEMVSMRSTRFASTVRRPPLATRTTITARSSRPLTVV